MAMWANLINDMLFICMRVKWYKFYCYRFAPHTTITQLFCHSLIFLNSETIVGIGMPPLSTSYYSPTIVINITTLLIHVSATITIIVVCSIIMPFIVKLMSCYTHAWRVSRLLVPFRLYL